MRIVFFVILLSLGLFACSESKQPVSEFELQTPRPFGYVIGDEIRHRIMLETRNRVKLQVASLPRQGPLSRWLNLNKIVVDERKSGSGFRYGIDLYYQVFYAPQEVKMLTIPGFSLQLMQGEKTAGQKVPAWNFTLSPLRELAVRKDESGEYRRPDAGPVLLHNDALVPGLLLSALATLASGAWLAYVYGLFPGLTQRSLFNKAAKKLARLSEHDLGQGLAILHQALNSLHRKPLFKHKLAEFYQQYPQYRAAGQQLDWFFEYSNRYFFTDSADLGREALDKLRILCAHCREIERGSR